MFCSNTIYNMDCFDLMRDMPDESVQLILTDPPYGIRYQNSFTRKKLPQLDGDAGIDYLTFAEQCYRVLQNNSHAYFFTRFDKYPYHYECLTKAGFAVKNCLVIEKSHVGGIGDLYGSYANNCEWIIFCHKGRRLFNETRLVKNTLRAGKDGGAPVRRPILVRFHLNEEEAATLTERTKECGYSREAYIRSLLACVIFSVFAATPPAVDTGVAAVTQVWSYIE